MTQASDIVADLDRLYRASVERLQQALNRYITDGTTPDPETRTDGSFAYPELRVTYRGGVNKPIPRRSFGRLVEAGDYRISVTRPAMFAEYLTEQLTFLIEDYDVEVHAVTGRQEIPFPYVLDPNTILSLDDVSATELGRHFPATELSHIGDEIADGIWVSQDETRPLALFDALRTDFSLARLKHYTGTPVEHFQQYILFTNYHRYVDEFVRWACAQLGPDSRFTGVSGAGGIVIEDAADADRLVSDGAWRRHQMPAYHLMAEGGTGITLVNIGVGPSNAKTITDHLAVIRPEAWLMIGHCGGLRPSQRIGDYVLAHAYLRDDHIMDDVLPPEIPIPAIAEVQQALARAAETVSGQSGDELKQRLRTGTIVTTDDRNWELRYSQSALRFSLSRAVGVDMESATLAAQGYRFRVPYGTLLCVSDKPLHGELKLPGQANRFYERAIAEHLKIGIEACEELRREGAKLHSRKLRAFNEPPFR
ncbi:AMP nucleosidase [Sphingomonas sp. ABOLD]|uniref:AMP nucleosidase n=1 Tax=Sphingomonas trueperi TaxID=53317 RepID=A0A7X6BD82_9SPHN|nr:MULTISPECIES: AMP nucleosidase [Sphingomonas]NJB97427.1 AMP nucleosidase [Sphingomonas trueperi]RSV35579.1 AMP nucleosidase [Sphingomonas sp. ABOLE]RSV45945.1 AMP nucleosidase [Sphingomonas sp. ABOLD]